MKVTDMDDDAPLATAGAKKKQHKGAFPPWVFLFLGSMVLVVGIGAVVAPMLRRSAKPAVHSVQVQAAMLPQETPAAPQPPQPPAPDIQPAPLASQPVANPVGQLPQPVTDFSPSPAQDAVQAEKSVNSDPPVQQIADAGMNDLRRQVTDLSEQVAELDARVNSLIAAFSGQSRAMQRILRERVAEESSSLKARSQRNVRGNYMVHAVVGTRVWLRPVDSSDEEVIVTHGDSINGSRIKEILAQQHRIILENGTVIQ